MSSFSGTADAWIMHLKGLTRRNVELPYTLRFCHFTGFPPGRNEFADYRRPHREEQKPNALYGALSPLRDRPKLKK